MNQGEREKSLTGVWHGTYSYTTYPQMPESHFVATLIDSGTTLSGTIHEVMNHYRGGFDTVNAIVTGSHDGNAVLFLKSYDGTAGLSHTVHYSGSVSWDRLEIEGNWHIPSPRGHFRGRFLMIRRRGQTEMPAIEIAEHVQ